MKEQTQTNKKTGFFMQLSVEQKKVKYRKIWMIAVGVVFLQFIWSAWTFGKADERLLSQGYRYLLYEMPVLNAVFMPVLMAVIASRLCDAEVKGDTFKLLFTMQKSGTLFDCKLVFGIRYVLLVVFLQAVMIIADGIVFDFTETMDIKLLLIYCAATFIVNVVVLVVQQFLSLTAQNQILPLCVGLAGSFLGLFSLFFPRAIQMFVLWGYYAMFMPLEMHYDKAARVMSFSDTPLNLGLMLAFAAAGVILYAGMKYLFVRREV